MRPYGTGLATCQHGLITSLDLLTLVVDWAAVPGEIWGLVRIDCISRPLLLVFTENATQDCVRYLPCCK
jgi:hypothetical protein